MMRIKHWIFILFFYQVITLFGMDAHLGIRLCNNEWKDYWVITPSPEIGLSWKYFQLSVDGTYGLFSTSDPRIEHVTQTRFSLVPMLKLELPGPIFLATGLGLSHSFRREELIDGTVRSEEGFYSDFRAMIGGNIPLRAGISIMLRGEYASITNTNRAFAFTLGLKFQLTQPSPYNIKPYALSSKKTRKSEQPTPLPMTPIPLDQTQPQKNLPVMTNKLLMNSLRTFSMVHTKDAIINELNTAIESTLIASGYKVISWERVQQAAANTQLNKPDNKKSLSILQSDIKITKPFDVAQLAYKDLKLHAFIETNMRYEYISYGGNILVHSANMRLIVPATGELLWATEFNVPESTFIKCKVKLAMELLNALKTKKR